ncbi:MAG: MFS transporter, partial [Planctomycetota bacterium]
MRPLSFQFFANFAVLGCVLPYLTVYLVEARGMTETQAGLLYGVHGLSLLFTPVLLTLFADTRITNRKLLAGCFAIAAVGLAGMLLDVGIAAIVAGYFVFRFAFSPIMSLEDGLAFAEQHADTQANRTPRPYHATRIWGTYGFLGGTAAIYALLNFGWPIGVAIGSATVWCVLGVINSARRGSRRSPRCAWRG